jgi:DNA-binding transcriptional MerR regulator/predicted transcriptional regulator YdeE
MSLIQIGEAAKIYSISRRSLRYWEEKGILNSTRGENGYRMYDGDNLNKIRQIIILKKLELPIQDIYLIFMSNDLNETIRIFKNHLTIVKKKASEVKSLALILELIISKAEVKSDNNIFSLIESIPSAIDSDFYKALLALNERSYDMDNEVRIVNLPKMTFACYRAESETPEDDCAKVMNKFIEENGIKHMQGFRHFGFNNPNPTEGTPIYGYEMWAVVPSNFAVPSPLYRKDFRGGLFASLTCTLADIGERWSKLYNWVMESKRYELDYKEGTERIGLEECINYDAFYSPDASFNDRQLDLYIPIKEK